MDTSQRIAYLILKQLKDELDEHESLELQNWFNESEENRLLHRELTNSDSLQQEMISWYKSKQNILAKIREEIPAGKIIPLWKKMIAAAAIIVIVATGGYFLFIKPSPEDGHKQEVVKATDVIAPVSNRASITLSDGRKIYLDSVQNGAVANEGSIQVTKEAEGKVNYNAVASNVQMDVEFYNTLINPRGSQVIDITLSDGSRVWLNAGSSIKYPVNFIRNERKVEITGEAYFEVTHNAKQPFKVLTGKNSEVDVLGTHFNVNAYDDNDDIKVTLLEGSVKFSQLATHSSQQIKPGQQAVLSHDSRPDSYRVTVHDKVNLSEITAWKDGLFHFESGDLKSILKEFSRWYDVDIVYEGAVSTDKFFVIIKRNSNLSSVLKALQAGGVDFTIEGKQLTVKSKH